MVREDTDAADRVRSELRRLIGERRYTTWFDSRVDFRLKGETALQVLVGSVLERDCLKRQFVPEIEAACRAARLGDRRIDLCVGSEPGSDRETAPRKTELAAIARPAAVAEPQPASVQATPSCRAVARGGSAFDGFVVSEGSVAAVTLAQQVAAGEAVASPLLIWGPTGVGKTHLLRSIRQEVRNRKRRIRAVFLTAEQFTTGFVDAVRGRGLPIFRNKYRGVDLLLIDDLQFFIGKAKTLEELHHTLDKLAADGAQVVLACDRPPTALQGLGGELVSRLTAGLTVELPPADYETRRRLTRQLSDHAGLAISDEVVDAVAGGISGGAREITGVINRLRVASELIGSEVDTATARRFAEETNAQTTPRVGMADIQSAVCRVFGVDKGVLRSDKRTKAVTEPRMLAMWLSRKYTRAAWSEIGAYFGRRSHSTVISACRRVDTLMNRDPSVRSGAGSTGLQDAVRQIELELRTA